MAVIGYYLFGLYEGLLFAECLDYLRTGAGFHQISVENFYKLKNKDQL